MGINVYGLLSRSLKLTEYKGNKDEDGEIWGSIVIECEGNMCLYIFIMLACVYGWNGTHAHKVLHLLEAVLSQS